MYFNELVISSAVGIAVQAMVIARQQIIYNSGILSS